MEMVLQNILSKTQSCQKYTNYLKYLATSSFIPPLLYSTYCIYLHRNQGERKNVIISYLLLYTVIYTHVPTAFLLRPCDVSRVTESTPNIAAHVCMLICKVRNRDFWKVMKQFKDPLLTQFL